MNIGESVLVRETVVGNPCSIRVFMRLPSTTFLYSIFTIIFAYTHTHTQGLFERFDWIWTILFVLLDLCSSHRASWCRKGAITSWFAKRAFSFKRTRFNHSLRKKGILTISLKVASQPFFYLHKSHCFSNSSELYLIVFSTRRVKICPSRIWAWASWVASRDDNHYTMPLPLET